MTDWIWNQEKYSKDCQHLQIYVTVYNIDTEWAALLPHFWHSHKQTSHATLRNSSIYALTTLIIVPLWLHLALRSLLYEKMPSPDVLACCRALGKRSWAMSQEFLFSLLRWRCGRVNTLTGVKTVRRETVVSYKGSDFPYGLHLRLGLNSTVAESKPRHSQQCASYGTRQVFRTCLPEPWTDPNITWTLPSVNIEIAWWELV